MAYPGAENHAALSSRWRLTSVPTAATTHQKGVGHRPHVPRLGPVIDLMMDRITYPTTQTPVQPASAHVIFLQLGIGCLLSTAAGDGMQPGLVPKKVPAGYFVKFRPFKRVS